MNLQDIKKKIEAKEHVDNQSFANAIAAEIDTARFMILLHPMMHAIETALGGLAIFDGKRELVECKVDQTSRFKVADQYKICFTPAVQGLAYRNEEYYFTDFTSMIMEGHLKIL